MNKTEVKLPSIWKEWQITACLGGGSFGTVYEIQRKIFGTDIERAAMKVIRIPKDSAEIQMLVDEGYAPAAISQRFQKDLQEVAREYGWMASLKGNTNVVYCDDIHYEQNPDGIGWTLYIRMELLTPLMKALKGPITYGQVVKVGMDLCNALAACKRKNIIHRDIKPGNIMVAEDGSFKLGDFGVAKNLERNAGGTKTGTYSYMAPEVYNHRPYGQSADIYSLGMVLYWMLNQRCGPFLPLPPTLPSATEADQALSKRFSGQTLPDPACGSQSLRNIVLKACAFDPDRRYGSPEEMYAELAEAKRELEDNDLLHKPMWQENQEISRETSWQDKTMGNSWAQEYETTRDQGDEDQDISLIASDMEYSPPVAAQKPKSKAIAILLAVFPYTGLFGVHDFYLGKKSAIWKLCTVNFCVLGWIFDLVLMILGKYKTNDGNYL